MPLERGKYIFRCIDRKRCKQYRESNPTKIKEYTAAHYYANRDRLLADAKIYHEEHREEIKAQQRQYTETHKEERRRRGRKYYLAHKEQRIAASKAYNDAHREEIREKDRERYKAKVAARKAEK